jgi:hydrogenase maturation protease
VTLRVIGVGTREGDDAAGLLVAAQLRASGLAPGVEVRECQAPGRELLEELDGAFAVVLVDATRSGRAPGCVHRPDAALLAGAAQLSSHGLGVAEVLRLARALGRLPARLELVGIEAGEARSGEPSAAVRGAIPRACGLVRDLIEELGGAAAPDREPGRA